METSFLALKTWAGGGGAWCGARTPPEISIQIFIHHTGVWDQPILCLHHSYQSQCGFFFNSVVVGFLFSSVSDSSGWWLFYSLIVILMWLCKEAKCVYLCCHLDQKSLNEFDYVLFDNSIPDLYFPIKY